MEKLLLTSLAVALVTTGIHAQDWAKARLEKSPRHQEWVKVKQGERDVHCFVVFPEVKDKATAVVVIHENRGLTDWVRGVADQLAEAGFIAIAPDLLSGTGPNGGKTSDFTSQDEAGKAIYALKPDQVTADLNAVVDYAAAVTAGNGKVAVSGFCWGGSQTFRLATNNKKIKAGFVFYGSGPEAADEIKRIECPIYGFYGGNDARVNATIPKSAELMKAAGKTYEPKTYDGAGHGFMRAGEDPAGNADNKKAREEGWTRFKELLKKI